MKPRKQSIKNVSLFSTLMVTLVFFLFSTTAFAIGMQANVSPLSIGDANTLPTVVTFAGVEWYVIGYNGSGVYSSAGDNSVTLLFRTGGYGATPFRDSGNTNYTTNANEYLNSTLQQKLASMAADTSIIPAKELALINLRTLTAANDSIAGGAVAGQALWPLSETERIAIQNSGVNGYYSASYWTRTNYNDASADKAYLGHYQGGGVTVASAVTASNEIRPALSLSLADVLFSSTAYDASGTQTKSSATVGSGLSSVSAPNGYVKFTMIDNTITTPSLTLADTTSGTNAIRFGYSGATTGTNQYISCVLRQGGVVIYYGKLADCASNGSGVLTIPTGGLTAGQYELEIFSEQANGDFYTDFASDSVKTTLTIDGSGNGTVDHPTKDTTRPIVSAVTPSGSLEATSGSIVITFSEAMNPSSGVGAVSLDNGIGTLSGGVWSGGNTIYTLPYSGLTGATTYTLSIDGFQDATGNEMLQDTTHVFMTALAPTITSADSASFMAGTGGSHTFTATGNAPITFTITEALPTGVTLVGDVLTVDNTAAVGNYTLTVTASNGTNPNATQTFALSITAAPVGMAPIITSGNSLNLYFSTGGFFQVTATGAPAPTFSLSGAPNGVTIDSVTGRISIAPTTSIGTHTFTITASNGTDPPATQTFTLTIMMGMAAPVIMSPDNINIVYGAGGTFQVSASGNPAPTYSLSGAPSGVTIDPNTGLITIADTVKPGTYTFTIIANNGIDPEARQTFTLTVGKVSDVPKTGDNFPLEWLTLTFVLLVSGAVVLLRKSPGTKTK